MAPGSPYGTEHMGSSLERALTQMGVNVTVISFAHWASALATEKDPAGWPNRSPAPGQASRRGLGVDLHVVGPSMDALSGDLAPEAKMRLRIVDELCALARRDGTPVLALDAAAHMVALCAILNCIEPLPALDLGFTVATDPRGVHPDRRVAVALGEYIRPEFAEAPDVTVLRSAPNYEIAAFGWGERVVAAQYLPDWGPETMLRVLDRYGPRLADKGASRRRALAALRREAAAETWTIEALTDLLADVADLAGLSEGRSDERDDQALA